MNEKILLINLNHSFFIADGYFETERFHSFLKQLCQLLPGNWINEPKGDHTILFETETVVYKLRFKEGVAEVFSVPVSAYDDMQRLGQYDASDILWKEHIDEIEESYNYWIETFGSIFLKPSMEPYTITDRYKMKHLSKTS
jgi:hypothetical protein